MSEKTVSVVFTGKLVEGASQEQVMANFCKMFKADMAKIEPMFSGKPVVIKKGVPESVGKKYQEALYKAGALCKVIDPTAAKKPAPAAESSEPPSTPAAAPQPAPPASEEATPPSAEAGSASLESITKATVKEAPSGPGLDASIAEPGVVIVEHEAVEPPQIDTSHLDVGAAGEALAEPEEVPELDVDLSSLSMAEAGIELVEHEPVDEPQIDTSKLSIS